MGSPGVAGHMEVWDLFDIFLFRKCLLEPDVKGHSCVNKHLTRPLLGQDGHQLICNFLVHCALLTDTAQPHTE